MSKSDPGGTTWFIVFELFMSAMSYAWPYLLFIFVAAVALWWLV